MLTEKAGEGRSRVGGAGGEGMMGVAPWSRLVWAGAAVPCVLSLGESCVLSGLQFPFVLI